MDSLTRSHRHIDARVDELEVVGRELVVARRRHCVILLKNRSSGLRARYRCGLKKSAWLRFRRGGLFAQQEHCPGFRARQRGCKLTIMGLRRL